MPEELTEEQTRDAFAHLRAEALAQIRPPGTAAASRAVRHRRRTGLAAVAAGVGITMAGVAAVPALVDVDRLRELADAANAAPGLDRLDNRDRKGLGMGRVIMSTGGPIVERYPRVAGTGSSEAENGDYVLEVLCVGEGTLRAHFWGQARRTPRLAPLTPPPDSAAARVPCGNGTTPTALTVRAPRPDMVFIRVEPDETAVGRAAYAALVRLP